MALTLGSAGGLRTVTGVYEGQGTNAIPIGTQAWTAGGGTKPLVIGFSSVDEASANIKVFFDPSLSPLARDEEWDQIGFIQTGEFQVQGVPLTVSLHDNSSPYPVYNKKRRSSPIPYFVKWINTPKSYNNPPQKTQFPEYPLWELTNKPTVNLADLYSYPQQFGGYTKYNPQGIQGRKQGENLCAFMNLDLDLSLIDLPFDSVNRTYFNTLDFNDLESQFEIPDTVQFKANYIYLYLYDGGIIPPGAQIQQTVTLTGKQYFLIWYKNEFKRRENTTAIITYGAAWQDESGIHFALLDDDLIEEWAEGEKIYGRPDLTGLNQKLFSAYQSNLNNLKLENFRISYQYYTYACGIKLDTGSKTYEISLFEGIGIEVIRQYYYIISGNENWMPVGVHTFELNQRMKRDFIKAVQIFFEKQNSEYDLVTPLIL